MRLNFSSEKKSSPAQQVVLKHQGHTLCRGVPGCGKTFLIEQKVRQDIEDNVNEEDCLVLVFARRSRAIVAQRMNMVEVSTIHSHRLHHLDIKFVDYDSLLKLRHFGEKQYQRIYLDELQDLSRRQWNIACSLLHPDGVMFAVGDPYQRVFAWAKAYKDIFSAFEEKFSTKAIDLLENRRSAKNIVKAAECIYRRGMVSTRDSIGKVEFHTPEDLSDTLILVRTNAALDMMSRLLSRLKIEHHLSEKGDEDETDYAAKHITVLRTCTRSKGEERSNVVLLDWNRGDEDDEKESTEEERKLFYTGMTRAMDELYITKTDIVPSSMMQEVMNGFR